MPQIKDANAKREWPAITTHNQGNHGVRTERWRYIHYADPYHTIGGGVLICKSPQTARFIANVRVPLDFNLGAHLEAIFGPENDPLKRTE